MIPNWMRATLCALVVFPALASAPARAAWEASAGYADELDDEASWTTHVTWLSEHRYPWGVTAGFIAEREDLQPQPSPDTFYVSFARRYVHRSGFFFAGGIALANTNGDDEVLSGPLQFVNGIGWQGTRIVVAFRHISNGSTRGRNRGENLLTVGWRF